jgi:hypothetical protein
MKTLTWTAVLAAIVALPLVIGRRKRLVLGVRPASGGSVPSEVLRYDIDDLLT